MNAKNCYDYEVAQVAQSVEQWPEEPRVVGSIPILGTISSISIAIIDNNYWQ